MVPDFTHIKQSKVMYIPLRCFWKTIAQHLSRLHTSHHIIVPTVHDVGILKTILNLTTLHQSLTIYTATEYFSHSIVQAPGSDANILSYPQQLTLLYIELRRQLWLKKRPAAQKDADLLSLAQTLLSLSDELTQRWLPRLQCMGENAFQQHWLAALATLSHETSGNTAQKQIPALLSDEAALVWTLWKSQLDRANPHVHAFEQLLVKARTAIHPLIWISPTDPDPITEAFFTYYAAPILQIQIDWCERHYPALLVNAWPEAFNVSSPAPSGHTRPQVKETAIVLSPVSTLDAEAQQALHLILQWLSEEKTALAVIVQNHIVARRLTALLKRHAIHMMDESGWKLSTTLEAASLIGWINVAILWHENHHAQHRWRRANQEVLLSFLKLPGVLAFLEDLPSGIAAIEISLRQSQTLYGLTSHITAGPILTQLTTQAALLKEQRSLTDWRCITEKTLEALGITTAWEKNTVGQQILQELHTLGQVTFETLPNTHFSLSEWRALLHAQLERTSFVQSTSDPHVVFLSLKEARLRRFDAVIVLGADAAHLPIPFPNTLFFANSVRRELHLETRETWQQQQLRDVIALICCQPQVIFSWQTHQNDEINPVSPWLRRLQLHAKRAEHCLFRSWEKTKEDTSCSHHNTPLRRTSSPRSFCTNRKEYRLPLRISATAWQSLMTCPYQFFVRYILGCCRVDNMTDLPEKRDYGRWLHRILHTYHNALTAHPLSTTTQQEHLLMEISAKYFHAELAHNTAALPYYVRWQKVIPSYIAWSHQRYAEGWRFYMAEKICEKPLVGMPNITLYGRIDRIDRHMDGAWAILDYKTQSLATLKKKCADPENSQLAFYGCLLDFLISMGHYVCLDNTVDDVALSDYSQQQLAQQAHMVTILSAIADGAHFPANGTVSACRYCEVRGVCRKKINHVH